MRKELYMDKRENVQKNATQNCINVIYSSSILGGLHSSQRKVIVDGHVCNVHILICVFVGTFYEWFLSRIDLCEPCACLNNSFCKHMQIGWNSINFRLEFLRTTIVLSIFNFKYECNGHSKIYWDLKKKLIFHKTLISYLWLALL